jgi:uncharacterized membrane protein YbhN (UPF0104 family)
VKPASSARKRWLLRGLRLAILVAVVYGVRRSLLDGLHRLDEHSWHLDFVWLAAAGALYLVSLLPAALFWHRILRRMGQDAGVGETLRAYYIGHLGKYVPGKALVVILRAGLIQSHRVDPVVAGTSVFVETLTLMAVGGVLSAIIIPFWFADAWRLVLLALAFAAASGLPTLPPVFRLAVRFVPFLGSDPGRMEYLGRLRATTLLWGWAANLVGWLVSGVSLWATVRALGADEMITLGTLPLFTAAAAMSTVGGFLSMIPAGIVVREALLGHLLAGTVGASVALVAAIVFRLVQLVSEVVISGILYLAGLRRPAPAVQPPE